MADKKVIMKFKKSASTEEKTKLIDGLKAQGASITNDEHVNSKVMSYIVLTIPEQHFETLQSESLNGGHDVIDHVEEDGEMHIM